MNVVPRVMILFLLAVWLEQSLLPFILPGQVSFRLVTLLVINLGVIRGPNVGAIAGFILGMPVALLTGQSLGVSSLVLTCVGWTAGWIADRLHPNVPGVTFLLTIGMLAMEWALTSAFIWLFFDVSYRFSWINFVAAILVSPVVLWMCRLLLTRPTPSSLYT